MSRFAIALLLTPGCQLAHVEVEVEEVRLAYRDVEIKGAHGVRAAKQSFVFEDLAALEDLIGLGAKVSFAGAELRATAGIDTLGFVDETRIMLGSGDPMSNLQALTAYDCVGNCKSNGNKLEMAARNQHLANDYISSGSILLDIELIGEMPSRPWTADFDVVLAARIDYALEP